MRSLFPRRPPFGEPIEWPRLRLIARFGSHAGKVAMYLAAYRQAKAAQEMHEKLSRMSDADLARIGIARGDIMRHVRDQLDPAP